MQASLDRLLGQSIRRIHEPGAEVKSLYLTFDDGPNSDSTPEVLETLETCRVPATFFVVARKAAAKRQLVQDIRANGHAIGNHSLDHRYGSFFSGRAKMLEWITSSEEMLKETTGAPSVGFRPPAGVRTPELHWALKQLNLPLVMWQRRFYDTVVPWNEKRALRSLASSTSGEIILLHDAQPVKRLPGFLKTLASYIKTAQQQGYEFRPLTRALCQE
ncbi:MAG: polysaccharide deacetylase family protein [Deltaproteobacteria bacterium]|nr:polysaccharide deacetylase family protein [Deltaproteobacteria bacterium]